MNRPFIYIILSLLLTIISSCVSKPRYSRHLLSLEERLEVNPDSVLTVVEQIDPTHLPAQDRALHGLLLTRAKLKNHIFESDDSIISESIKYFREVTDNLHLMKSLYHQAVILLEAQDPALSIIAATESQLIAESDSNYEYLARTHEVMSDIYLNIYNKEESLKQRRLSALYYDKAGNKLNKLHAYTDIARALMNMEDYSNSISISDSLLKMIPDNIPTLRYYILETLAESQISVGDIHNAKINLDIIDREFKDESNVSQMLLWSEYYVVSNQAEKASMTLTKLIETNPNIIHNYRFLSTLYSLQKNIGLYKEALSTHEQISFIQNSSVYETLNEEVEKSRSIIFKEISEKERINAKNNRIRLLIVGFSIIILTLIPLLYSRFKLRLNKLKMKEDFNQISELFDTLTSRNLEISEMKSSMDVLSKQTSSLYKERFITFNKICDEYFAKHDSEKLRPTIYTEIEKEILSLKNPKRIKDIEESVNLYFDNIAIKFRNDFTQISETDKIFTILYIAGLSTSAICILTNITKGNYYTKRQRIRNHIIESNSPNKGLYLQLLDWKQDT